MLRAERIYVGELGALLGERYDRMLTWLNHEECPVYQSAPGRWRYVMRNELRVWAPSIYIAIRNLTADKGAAGNP